MAITSFQHFLKSSKPKPSDFLHFIHLLLRGVSLHATECAAEDSIRFSADIDGIANSLTEQSSSEEILIAVGAINRLLEEHNRHASSFATARAREMRAMVSMMSSTIAFLASSSEVGVEQLLAIEGHIEEAVDIEDVHLSRLRLADCLNVVREETLRLRDVSQKQIQVLKESLERVPSPILGTSPESTTSHGPVPTPSIDPTTGLRSRMEAERKIESIIARGSGGTVAIFLVDRLASLNSRFGRSVGDEILNTVAKHLRTKLPDTNPPFRWSGPAFVAFMDDPRAASRDMRLDIKKITASRLEKTFDAGGRSVLVPISCSAVLLDIVGAGSVETVCRTIDRSVASQGGQLPPEEK